MHDWQPFDPRDSGRLLEGLPRLRRGAGVCGETLTEDAKGRHFNFTDVWKKYGYYPFDIVKTESVSRTLEHAYDDWCAARFAEALGKKDDAAYFDRRANNWTNVFDRSVGFARGRDTKGNWREPFSPFKLNVGGRGTGPKRRSSSRT